MVRSAELVVSNYVVWRYFGPAGCPEEMLGFDGWVTEEERVLY